jgi:hypothetical protein
MPISSIKVDVDQATFRNWSMAMINLSRTFTIRVVPAPPLGSLPPLPRELSFTGVDLMNQVGHATTRLEVINDPDRLFALFRYGTKIGKRTPNISLSSETYISDPHKKAVLSDELGSGFALLAAERILGVSLFLDLHHAIDLSLVATGAPNSSIPDYIGLYGPNSTTVVLEAKGSQSRAYCRRKQIPKGCAQVKSVSVSPGKSGLLRVVVGTVLRKDSDAQYSETLIGDPEEDEPAYSYEFDQSLENAVARENYMRIAALIGDEALLRRAEQPTKRASESQLNLVERTIGNRSAVGSTFEIRSGRSVTGFFVGIDFETRERMLGFLSTQRALPEVVGQEPAGGRSPDQSRFSHYSITRDGTVLEVWSEGPLVNEITRE